MGIPYSQEVKAAVDLASELKGHATLAIYAVVVVSAIHTILLAVFLVAVIALLITVNPDLDEERKAFVTPVVRWMLLPLRGWNTLVNLGLGTTAISWIKTAVYYAIHPNLRPAPRTSGRAGRERRRGEEVESDNRNSYESGRGQRRRNPF